VGEFPWVVQKAFLPHIGNMAKSLTWTNSSLKGFFYNPQITLLYITEAFVFLILNWMYNTLGQIKAIIIGRNRMDVEDVEQIKQALSKMNDRSLTD